MINPQRFLSYIIAFSLFILTAPAIAQVTEEDSLQLEEEAEDEPEEGDFDSTFTGYNDVNYWDVYRDPGFKFDSSIIPASDYYPFGWDTMTINPYKVDLRSMNDTILLTLKDSMDCSFHPPAIGDITSGF